MKAALRGVNLSQIMRSLKKSRVRTRIIMYLYKIYPDSSYPSDISRQTKIDPTNVIGGLRGMGSRYNETNSLIGIKLVEEVQLDGATYYKLTDTGKELMESMKLI
jgi:predicted transcriptional regulator with HTH domain